VELLRSQRLLLRDWEESDLPAFFDLYSRDDVTRWLGPQPRRALTTMAEARERLHRWMAAHRGLDAPLGLWAIVPLISGAQQPQPAGSACATKAPPTAGSA
jgi:RimJ/RimL family protein N-acetyltransferase